MSGSMVASSAQGFVQQVDALLDATDADGDDSGFVARCRVFEASRYRTHQVAEATEIALELFVLLFEDLGFHFLPLLSDALDERVEGFGISRLDSHGFSQETLRRDRIPTFECGLAAQE